MRFSIRSFRVPFRLGVIALVTLGPTRGCGSQQPKDPFAADTTYQRRLAYQQQVSRTVPTDSLMHMYVRLANASSTSEAGALAREISCESTRNALKYGVIPAAAAGDRAFDSLRRAQPEAFAKATAKFNHLPIEETTTTNAGCHIIGLRPAPDSLNVNPVPSAIGRKYPASH
jgi:hypothetical protein